MRVSVTEAKEQPTDLVRRAESGDSDQYRLARAGSWCAARKYSRLRSVESSARTHTTHYATRHGVFDLRRL